MIAKPYPELASAADIVCPSWCTVPKDSHQKDVEFGITYPAHLSAPRGQATVCFAQRWDGVAEDDDPPCISLYDYELTTDEAGQIIQELQVAIDLLRQIEATQ